MENTAIFSGGVVPHCVHRVRQRTGAAAGAVSDRRKASNDSGSAWVRPYSLAPLECQF
jgi:hypothetical protein